MHRNGLRRRRIDSETVGANLGFLERRVKSDLERFEEFIKSRQRPTGAFHGDEVIEPGGGERAR